MKFKGKNMQKNPSNTKSLRKMKLMILAFGFVCVLPGLSKASVTINYEVAEITSAGTNISAGTLLFISHGADNTFNSNLFTSGTSSFLVGDDKLFAAVRILNGVASGALNDLTVPTGTVNTTTKFTGLFISGISSTELDYATGILKGGLVFGTSGTTYQFGTYRSDSIEAFGGSLDGNIAWIFPAEGSTVQLSAYSNTGIYTGATYTAALATTSAFTVGLIPEPSTVSLLLVGSLLAIRRRKAAIK